jgi:nitrite reductase (NADH) large subunit
MSEPLLIVGKGMAAARLAEELTRAALGRYAIGIIGAEPGFAYNRVLLSSLLAREVTASDVELRPDGWWSRQGITVITGQRVDAVDVHHRTVTLAGGAVIPWRKLVFATGAQPLRLSVPGAQLTGVQAFRDRADVEHILSQAKSPLRAVVVGGGLLGLEAAYGLAKAGARVTVIHLMDRLMERQLDPHAGEMLRAALAERGIDVILEAETKEIVGAGRVEGVVLADGRHIPADLVIMAIGIRPNIELATNAGIVTKRGIVVDDHLETTVRDVFAIGECAEHRGQCYGLVEPAYDQARVLAQRLAGRSSVYTGSVMATNLKVSGVNVFSAGDFLGGANDEIITFSDPVRKTYRRLVARDNKLVGVVLFGDTADGLWYLSLMRDARPIGAMRSGFALGRAFTEEAA